MSVEEICYFLTEPEVDVPPGTLEQAAQKLRAAEKLVQKLCSIEMDYVRDALIGVQGLLLLEKDAQELSTLATEYEKAGEEK